MDDINSLIRELAERNAWPKEKIPDIDLYMDQVTTLMEEHLGGYRRQDGDKILSKTMINNYAKDKLIPSPEKKKYSKEHVMTLAIIFHLKSLLSINDIRRLLLAVTDIPKLYDDFEAIRQTHRICFDEEVAEVLRTLPEGDGKSDAVLLALTLIDDANMKKQLAERIIDKLL